jgi:hypothetical protein
MLSELAIIAIRNGDVSFDSLSPNLYDLNKIKEEINRKGESNDSTRKKKENRRKDLWNV